MVFGDGDRHGRAQYDRGISVERSRPTTSATANDRRPADRQPASLVDEAPVLGGGGVDRAAGEAEGGGALASDPSRQAHGAAGTGMSPSPISGSATTRVGVGDHVRRERRDLDATAQRRTVDVGLDALAEVVDQAGRTAGEAGDVCGGRIGPDAELVEVATAAERRPVPAQDDRGDRVVDIGDRQRGVQLVAELRSRWRCGDAAGRATIGQPVCRRARPRPPVRRRCPARRRRRPPRRELRAGLQHRVGGRFGGQPAVHRQRRLRPQQHRERRRGDRGRGRDRLDATRRRRTLRRRHRHSSGRRHRTRRPPTRRPPAATRARRSRRRHRGPRTTIDPIGAGELFVDERRADQLVVLVGGEFEVADGRSVEHGPPARSARTGPETRDGG